MLRYQLKDIQTKMEYEDITSQLQEAKIVIQENLRGPFNSKMKPGGLNPKVCGLR
jgi:hypothetical protein